MKLTLPALSLVVLAGPSGSGKSTFARRHFKPTEVLSSDRCRGWVADDETDQSATPAAFEVLRCIAKARLAGGRLTVIDATNVKPEDRKPWVDLARATHVLPVVMAFDLPPTLCQARNEARPERRLGAPLIRQQSQWLRRSLKRFKREGFRHVTVLSSPEEADAVQIERQPLWTDRRNEHGPFDIIGDIHGCFDELVELLTALGYQIHGPPERPRVQPPAGRRTIFLGDLVDRGPKTPAVLRLVMAMVEDGSALCLPGNHEMKLLRKLRGREVTMTHGLAETWAQLENEPTAFKEQVRAFLDGLVSHYLLDEGQLVVAHAGIKAEFQGRASVRVREFALYGETTGESDAFGRLLRYDWARDYRGNASVVYGHTPVPEPQWTNRTLCIDTGCVFGGKLTALRYPEKALVQVPAKKVYYAPASPLPLAPERPYPDLLDIDDVQGKRRIPTRFSSTVTLREANTAAALEVMSRFALDPRWLIYLPPTMAPPPACPAGEYLEHPNETFASFRRQGVPQVVCQEKHMGSRAVMIVCRDKDTAQRRFGISSSRPGVVYTRTGRPFFTDKALHTAVLERLQAALARAGLWTRFETDWLALDAEILPWSLKAEALLRHPYAATGASASAALDSAIAVLGLAAERGDGSAPLLSHFKARRECIGRYIAAYRRYCWPVERLSDVKIAPFQLLATAQRPHLEEDPRWHMDVLTALCRADETLFRPTAFHLVDLADPQSESQGTAWWEALTAQGGEGMVVKPVNGPVAGQRGRVQPALKCRGREYLRLIYGPEYTFPEQIDRLRERRLAAKRTLALREFALGAEALHRFVEGEPLYRVHECVFGILALESEPVDPRL